MKKRILSLAMAACMLIGASLTAQAEDFQSGDGWDVTFDGKKIENSFTSADIDRAIYDILPGDSIEIHLGLKNTSEKSADWYMTNEVLQSLEDSTSVAEGGAYTYVLQYVDAAGEAHVLYSSEAVGGEKESAAGEGLHEATDSLEDYFFLGRMEAGKSGEIVLKVALEGETQGNAYQNTLARLQMNFAVEPTVEGSNRVEHIVKTIKTGDNAKVIVFVIVTFAAGLVCLIFAFGKLKKRDKNTDEPEDRRKGSR